MPMYRIIFRTCDAVHSLHAAPRPFGLDKPTLIRLCFLSLYDSLQGLPFEITIVGDRLSDEIRAFFGRFPSVNVLNFPGGLGNDESIRETIRQALAMPDDDWVYFCEDDYLHTPQAMPFIDAFIRNRLSILDYSRHQKNFMRLLVGRLSTKPLVIHPTDYPDRYLDKYKRLSFLFLSEHCHWRQITNTTFTFLMQVRDARRFQRLLFHCARRANDRRLSRKLYGRLFFKWRPALGVSPIPGLAAHLHEGVMPPLVDWQTIIDGVRQRYAELMASEISGRE